MDSLLFEVAISILVLLFVIRFILRVIGWTAAPADPEPDALVGRFVRLRPRPTRGRGAVALAEPDDHDAGR